MEEDRKTLLRRFYEEVSAGNLGVIDETIADNFIDHEEFPGIEPNKEGVKQFFAMFRAAFPDFRLEAHEILAEGDLLCARATFTGTHQGDFMGMPPTGKRIEIGGFDMLRFREGRITEHWGLMDAMTMMQQLGAIPQQAPA
jgi:steroid delta-isomerase-like uncharacterized protein